LLTVMVHLSGCSAVSCHLTVYTKFRTPSEMLTSSLTLLMVSPVDETHV